MILSKQDNGATEGDDDEVVVQYGISNLNPETAERLRWRCKLRDVGCSRVVLDQIDDQFCNDFVRDNGIGNMCKVKLLQSEARLLEARRFKTLEPSAPESKKYPSFSAGGSSKAGIGASKASSSRSQSRTLTKHRVEEDAEHEELGEVTFPDMDWCMCIKMCYLELHMRCIRMECYWNVYARC